MARREEASPFLTTEFNGLISSLVLLYRQDMTAGYLPYGLPTGAVLVVEALAQGANTPSKIARRLHFAAPNITPVLNRLQAMGYIERERNPHDGRRVKLSFTQTGRELVREVNEARTQKLAPILDSLGLSPEDLEQFYIAFSALLEKWESSTGVESRKVEHYQRQAERLSHA